MSGAQAAADAASLSVSTHLWRQERVELQRVHLRQPPGFPARVAGEAQEVGVAGRAGGVSGGTRTRQCHGGLQPLGAASAHLTPGISTGDWKLRNRPWCDLASGDRASRSLPLKVTEPLVTS